MFNIGDKVITPHGFGEIVKIEGNSKISTSCRDYYLVSLETNPFKFTPAYWADELTKA